MKDGRFLMEKGIDVAGSLNFFGDVESYNEGLTDFMTNLSEKMKKIAKYKEEADLVNYAIYVHSLKSDAKYLGFKTLAEMSAKHEFESKNNNVDYVEKNYEALIFETKKIFDIGKEYLQGETSHVKRNPTIVLPPDKVMLVVDDSNMITNFVKRILGDGSNVICAANGVQGISFINEHKKNLAGILLDLNMPNLNGFQILNILNGNSKLKKIPVSIITGEKDPAELDKLKQYNNIHKVLIKPFNESDIRDLVEKMLKTE